MFDEVKTTKFITEHYTEFCGNVLVEKKPVANWPRILGQKAAAVINTHAKSGNIKVLVTHGGPGRSTLELLRKCSNLSIDHTDDTANKLQVLESLLENSRIQWYQQLEGEITEELKFHLDEGETQEDLLSKKSNTIAYWQADYRNLRPQLNGYDVIVADIRQKESAGELAHLAERLNEGGLFVLGSIDNTSNGVPVNSKHSLSILKKLLTKLAKATEEYPHIYRETRSKLQYAISYYSVWKKIASENDPNRYLNEINVIPNSNEVTTTKEYYEDKNILASYDRFHYGDGSLSFKNFPLRMCEVVLEACKKFQCPMKRALEAGCGPGRVSMELCSVFEQVEAYDYSHSFIEMLNENKKKQDLDNLSAYQGDGHKQIEICKEKQFDLIFGCNLLDRLHSPEVWLEQCKGMLSPTGLLVIASPYEWKPEHTAPEKWIGGFKKDGENFFTIDGLCAKLSPELVLLEETKVPFVIPDADGTFQYFQYTNCTVFGSHQKKSII